MSLDALIALGAFFALNFGAAASGAIFAPGDWYRSLNKPSWTPPDLAFPMVWTVLFTANAVAGWLVWTSAGASAAPAIAVYVVSLVLNFAWSALFFGAKRIDLALADVALLALSIIAVGVLFVEHSPLAAALQLPYLAWVLTAAALNYRIFVTNKAPVGAA